MAVNYLTLRSTISYATDGTQAPINSLMAVSSVGVTTWTNRIAISTLTASTITASTVSFSTMTVSTLNTFVVGQGAGTGAGNTVFGLNAATANTTGSGNTSFGFSTMSTNTTGIANTAMGYMALASNISSFNTAMGYAALASNISTMNTAVGALAMQNNTSGTLNVGIGYGALTSATNTIANTALGTNAITTTTTGSYNTAIGMQTLFYNTTGQMNTCLGYSAGLSGAGTFTGSYNTYLGHLAYPSGMGVVNEIVLGGSSSNSVANTGNGSNSVTIGNSATTKHIFTAGNVGIGTTIPNSIFNVLCNTTTSQSAAPDGGGNHGLLLTSPKTGTTQYSMAFGVDYTTGYGYINSAGNSLAQPILLQSRGGYVGIGVVTNPSAILTVQEVAINGDVTRKNMLYGIRSGTTGVQNGVSMAFSLGANVSTSNPVGALDIKVNSSTGPGNNYGTTPDLTVMSILGNGYVGIGTTAPSNTLHILGGNDGFVRMLNTNAPTKGWNIGPDSAGNYIIYTTGGVGVYLPFGGQTWAGNASDARSKTNIKSMDSVLDSLIKLRPVTFLYKTDPNDTIIRSGFIAQEVDTVFPKETGWIVTQNTGLKLIDDDGHPYNPYTISMTEMIPYIVKGVQELETENTQLKSAIAALEARLAAAGL